MRSRLTQPSVAGILKSAYPLFGLKLMQLSSACHWISRRAKQATQSEERVRGPVAWLWLIVYNQTSTEQRGSERPPLFAPAHSETAPSAKSRRRICRFYFLICETLFLALLFFRYPSPCRRDQHGGRPGARQLSSLRTRTRPARPRVPPTTTAKTTLHRRPQQAPADHLPGGGPWQRRRRLHQPQLPLPNQHRPPRHQHPGVAAAPRKRASCRPLPSSSPARCSIPTRQRHRRRLRRQQRQPPPMRKAPRPRRSAGVLRRAPPSRLPLSCSRRFPR